MCALCKKCGFVLQNHCMPYSILLANFSVDVLEVEML